MPQLPSGLSTKPDRFAPSGESSLRLQRAIESLALNLDDELNRYRRSRAGDSVVPTTPTRLPLRQTRKPIDLIALKTAAIAGSKPATPPPPPPNAKLRDLLGQPSEPSVQAYPPKTAINQVRLSHGGTLTTYRAAPDDYLESSEALLGNLPHGVQATDDSDYEPSLLSQLATPLGMGALLLLLVGSASFGYLITSPQAVSHLTDNPITRRIKGTAAPESLPSDGPSTTQALGNQLDAGQTNTGQTDAGQTDARFKPVGPDLSDQEFGSLDLSRISTLPSESSAATSRSFPARSEVTGTPRPANSSAEANPQGTSTATTSTPVGQEALSNATVAAPVRSTSSPTIAAQPSAVTPSRPTATVAPAAPARPTAPPVAMPEPPRPAPAQPPQPIAVNRTPPPLATPPAPLTAPAPVARPAPIAPPAPLTQAPPQAPAATYYVVTDYSGAQSLESARSAVGDAYVRNFSSGTRIQMGVFSQPSSAQNLVNQLQGQGIPAQVITP